MKAHRFLATDAADAVGQIRSRLGADAVVLSVAQVRPHGLARLWSRPRLEVLAGLPESGPDTEESAARSAALGAAARSADLLAAEQRNVESNKPSTACFDRATGDGSTVSFTVGRAVPCAPCPDRLLAGSWRSAEILRQLGLQPLLVERVLERARATHGEAPPPSLAQEIALVKATLTSFWRPASPAAGSPPIHVFVGPPGSGKTTAACKWLAKFVLAEGGKARVWRLDSQAANFAGLLDAYGEILGVPVYRAWTGTSALLGCDAAFVDLPGVSAQDRVAMDRLRTQVAAFPAAQVHLVLNAAYDISVLLAQVRAFAALPVTDLILTHLDEAKRRGKLWNLVLGTKFALRFLLSGQNIPGAFSAATPELLI